MGASPAVSRGWTSDLTLAPIRPSVRAEGWGSEMGRRPPLRLGEGGDGWQEEKQEWTSSPPGTKESRLQWLRQQWRWVDGEQELSERVAVHLLHPDKIHKLKPWPPVASLWPYLERNCLTFTDVNMSFLGWGLIHHDWHPQRKGTFIHRRMYLDFGLPTSRTVRQ